ncbi:MAG: nucleotidyltransferase [Phycisphaera sp.]|nr:nucleotidyltransferase [Phycisphaera sp.]
MTTASTLANHRLEALVELLDIPPSYYDLAAKRYRSLADWLHRPHSSVRQFDPDVYPQGSFRLGTVIRPLLTSEEYDLDLVSELKLLTKEQMTQRDLKHLVGEEVRDYVAANGINEPVEEKKRCWRIDYADTVQFHMDILPAIPQDDQFRTVLAARAVSGDQAELSIAITDTTHPNYQVVTTDWPPSNPKGFALWFEGVMRSVAAPQLNMLVRNRVYASVQDIPTYEWKTPLQRVIQLLKRHRDVMFRDEPDLKPISMIITTLSARGYSNESNLLDALAAIVAKMPDHIRPNAPRVPNPVNPAEDFADKWRSDSRLEKCFREWHAQVKVDLAALTGNLAAEKLIKLYDRSFGLKLGMDKAKQLATLGAVSAAPSVIVKSSPPRPWRRNA